MPQQQDPKMSFSDFRFAVNLTSWLAHTLSITTNVVFHYGCGERYIGIPGLIAIPLICVYAGFTWASGGDAMLWFLLVYIVMCLVWRVHAVDSRKRLHKPIHTRYGGKPWLSLLVPRWNEVKVKKIETLLVLIGGFAVTFANRPLGMFLMAAAGGMAVSIAISEQISRARMLDQIDAMLESKMAAEESRDLLGQ